MRLFANPVRHSVSTITHMCGKRTKRKKKKQRHTYAHTHGRYRDTDYQHNDTCHVSDCKRWQQQQQQCYHRRGDDENISDRHNKSKSKLIMTKLSSNAIFCCCCAFVSISTELPFIETFWINEINSLNKVGGKVLSHFLLFFFLLVSFRLLLGRKEVVSWLKFGRHVFDTASSSGWKRCGKHMPDCQRTSASGQSEMAIVWRKTRSMFVSCFLCFPILSVRFKRIQWDRWKSRDTACQRTSIM